MATNNSIDSNIPIEIGNGGTNVASMTAYGTLYYDTSSLSTISPNTNGYVLKSNGAGVAPSFQAIGPPGAVASAFLGNLSSDITSVTGDGTSYTVIWNNEIYDIGGDFDTTTGTFTAPSTANYLFISCVAIRGSSVNKGYDEIISTTLADFGYCGCLSDERGTVVGDEFEDCVAKVLSNVVPMDALDTAVVKVRSYDSGSANNDVAATTASYFCGYQIV